MFSRDVRRQYLAAFCVNILQVGGGACIGWPTISLLILKSKETPLPSGPLTIEQISWVGSLVGIGGLIGNVVFGWLSGRYGRKYPLMSAAIPQMLGWVLIMFARNPTYLYVSRFLSGFSSGATFAILPVFVAEISDNKVRGTLGSLLMFCLNFGFLVSYIVGYFSTYMMTPIILISIPVIFLMCMPFFPESPQFLLRIGKEEDAKKALCFYRNIDWNAKEELSLLSEEMDKLKSSTRPDQTDPNESNDKTTWRDFTTPVARKAICIGFILLAIKQFTGLYAMLNYAGLIFQEAGTAMDPNLCSIILGCIQLAGTYVPTLLIDRVGRKVLLTTSLAGTGIGLLIMGSYMYMKLIGINLDGFNWIPLASFSFVLFIGNCGLISVPYVIISEIMPAKIRSSGTSLCMVSLWVYLFIMFKFFPIMSLMFGLHGCFFIFSGITLFAIVYVIFVVPETKGKSFDEIMAKMDA